MSGTKERLDHLLVEFGYFDTIAQAKAAVMAGLVYLHDERLEMVAMRISRAQAAGLRVKGNEHRYVSRGGLKLAQAIDSFKLDLNEKVMIDIGASTGGFTDCALQHGVSFVYAIDVGYNQLAWKLRNDERVQVLERTNFRYVTADDLKGPQANFATIDVSFISLKRILPPLKQIFYNNQADVIALVKPQFEAKREDVGKAGIVSDPHIHKQVLEEIMQFSLETGYRIKGLIPSPIKGTEGNIEFLLHLRACSVDQSESWNDQFHRWIEEVLQVAHS